MINTEAQGLKHLLTISYPYVLFCLLYSIFIVSIEEYVHDHIYKMSGQLTAVFGLAVAFFLGFRMNSAYDRWWEARKIFGELVNNTGSFTNKLFVYFGNNANIPAAMSKKLTADAIDLTILYVRQLKSEMHNDFRFVSLGDQERLVAQYAIDKKNKCTHELLIALARIIESNFSESRPIEKADLMQQINRFYDIQGKAERIKNTPFLKVYSVFTRITVFIYVLMLPLFIGDIDFGPEETLLEFISIPIIVLLGSVFLTINQLASLFAEPFSQRSTSVTIDEICASIERTCLQVKDKLNAGSVSHSS